MICNTAKTVSVYREQLPPPVVKTDNGLSVYTRKLPVGSASMNTEPTCSINFLFMQKWNSPTSTVTSSSSGSSRASSKLVLCQPLEPCSMRIVRAALRPRNVFRSSRTASDNVIMLCLSVGLVRRSLRLPLQHIRNAGRWEVATPYEMRTVPSCRTELSLLPAEWRIW